MIGVCKGPCGATTELNDQGYCAGCAAQMAKGGKKGKK